MEKICENCWTMFISSYPHKRFCCKKCNEKWRLKRDSILRDRKCKYCWDIFQWTRKTKVCKSCLKELKSKAWYSYWNNLSKEDKARRSQKSREDAIVYWNNISEKDRQKREDKRLAKRRDTYNKLPLRDKMSRLSHMRNGTNIISKINRYREQELSSLWYNVELEYQLWSYFYDIKIDNILIEINPYPYHNTLRAPLWARPKDKQYHKNKIKNAKEYWYECLMVWDWDNENDILNMIYNKKTELIFTEGNKWERYMYINNPNWDYLYIYSIFQKFIQKNNPKKIYLSQDMSKIWRKTCEFLWFKLYERTAPNVHKWKIWKRKRYNDVEIYDAWMWKYIWEA